MKKTNWSIIYKCEKVFDNILKTSLIAEILKLKVDKDLIH